MLGDKSGMVRAKVRDTDPRMAFWYARSADGFDEWLCIGDLTLELCQTDAHVEVLQAGSFWKVSKMTWPYNFINFLREH